MQACVIAQRFPWVVAGVLPEGLCDVCGLQLLYALLAGRATTLGAIMAVVGQLFAGAVLCQQVDQGSTVWDSARQRRWAGEDMGQARQHPWAFTVVAVGQALCRQQLAAAGLVPGCVVWCVWCSGYVICAAEHHQ